jgi:serine/threonine-protein kinase ULK/ATG1
VFLKHIAEGFKHLYQLKIIHRDIKPANVMLSGGVAKITDFGFARMIETEMNGTFRIKIINRPILFIPFGITPIHVATSA